MQPYDIAINGRRLLFDQYQNHYDSSLKPAIDKFCAARCNFNDSLHIVNNRGPLEYNLKTHTFVNCIEKNNFPIPAHTHLWNRDHLIHCIDTFASNLFGFDEEKTRCVKAYLHHKLEAEGAKKFIHSGSHAKENKIFKFFNKIKDGKLKSFEEKANEKAYLNSDQYKIDQIEKKVLKIDFKIKQKQNSRPHIFDNLDHLIKQLNERLDRGISQNGRRSLECLLEAFSNLKSGLKNNESLSDIDFHMFCIEGQNYKNCLSDEVSREIDSMYPFLKNLSTLFAKKLNLLKELAVLHKNREQVDIHNPEPFPIGVKDKLSYEEINSDVEIDSNPIVEEEGNIGGAQQQNENKPNKTSLFSIFISSASNFFTSIWRFLKNRIFNAI